MLQLQIGWVGARIGDRSVSGVADAPLRGIRVLLVDDEADSRDVVTYVLEESGTMGIGQ